MIPKLLSENIPRNASLMDKFIATFLFWQPLHDHISHSFRRQHILEGAANNYGFLMCSSGFDFSLVSRFSAKVRSLIRQFTCTPRRLHVTFFDQSFPFPFITISNEANEQPISFYNQGMIRSSFRDHHRPSLATARFLSHHRTRVTSSVQPNQTFSPLRPPQYHGIS